MDTGSFENGIVEATFAALTIQPGLRFSPKIKKHNQECKISNLTESWDGI
jgi:hypothetical protein